MVIHTPVALDPQMAALLTSIQEDVDAGRWFLARDRLTRQLERVRRTDDRLAHAEVLAELAQVHELLGMLDDAQTHYRDALRLFNAVGDGHGEAACLLGLARVMIQRGHAEKALAYLDGAREVYRALGAPRHLAETERLAEIARGFKERSRP